MKKETTIFAHTSYKGLPLIKAYNDYVSIQIDNELAVMRLDCLKADRTNKLEFVCRTETRKFSFSTDLDSIVFDLRSGDEHEFYLLKDADHYPVMISGVESKDNKVEFDQSIIAYEKLQASGF